MSFVQFTNGFPDVPDVLERLYHAGGTCASDSRQVLECGPRGTARKTLQSFIHVILRNS